MAPEKGKALQWRHIGLYGHSVGTFTADPQAIHWKSVALDDDDTHTTRLIPARNLTSALFSQFGRSAHIRISSKSEKEEKFPTQELRFDGFPPNDFEKLSQVFTEFYDIDLRKHTMSSTGASWGKMDISGRHVCFRQCIMDEEEEEGEDGDEMFSMDLAEVSQCVLPGNTRNEIEIQFHESDTVEQGTDQLVHIRIYVAPDEDKDDLDTPTAAELFQQRVMKKANVKKSTGDVIAEFDESKGTFLTPRGRYNIELYDSFLRMRGNKYDYKIAYDDISRLFLLPKPDDVHMAFVIALDRPIRQGQQRYPYLVLQTTKAHSTLKISLDEETLKKEYNGDLQPVMNGSLANLVAKTFKVITKKKVFVPGKFTNSNQQPCVKCALRANEGHLYPLEKQFIFIHKPSVLIRFDEIESVEFQRYAGGQGSTRNFDLCVTLLDNSGDSTTKEYIFSGIDRTDYSSLYSFLSGKKIRVKNAGVGLDVGPSTHQPLYNENKIYGLPEGADEESSEDSDFDAAKASSSESEDISDDGDDDLPSDASDSDLEEFRQKAKKESRKVEKNKMLAKMKEEGGAGKIPKMIKKKVRDDDRSVISKKVRDDDRSVVSKKVRDDDRSVVSKKVRDDDRSVVSKKMRDDDRSVVSNTSKSSKLFSSSSRDSSSRPKEKKKGRESDPVDDTPLRKKPKKSKSVETKTPEKVAPKPKTTKKKKKDPNAPKKNWTSFMFFSNAKRAEISEKNPGTSFGDIAKLVGAQFKNLSDEDKQIWVDEAAKDKVRYLKEMESYTPPEADDDDDDDVSAKPAKKKKDPNMPKKSLSAYNYYFQAIRPDVTKENPDAEFSEIGRIIGTQYKALTQEQRQIYDDKAVIDKKRYRKAMETYEPPDNVVKDEKKKGSKTKVKKDPNAPKRNLTSYMIFTQESRSKIKEKNPEANFSELNKLLGEAFKALDEEGKDKYVKKAKVAKDRYIEDMKVYSKKKAALEEKEKEEMVSSDDDSEDTDTSSDSDNSDSDDSDDSDSD